MRIPALWAAILLACSTVLPNCAEAGSATWNLNPTDNLWHNAANWTPASVPNADSDTASFGVSNTTTVKLTKYAQGIYDGITTLLDKLVFEESASSYTIKVVPAGTAGIYLDIDGEGVINNSGQVQNIVVAASGDFRRPAWLLLSNDATLNENIVITNEGSASATGDGAYGALTEIGWAIGSAVNAGKATFINNGGTVSGTIWGGYTNLVTYSSAESATFINNPGTVSGAAAGHTLIQTFPPGGNLGTSTFIANPAMVPGAEGGWVEMDVGTCAGTSFIANGATVADCQGGQIYAYGAEDGTRLGVATFTANGGNGSNAQGGLIDVFHLPLSDQTIVIANAGTNGGLGGTILLEDTDDLPVPQFQVFGNGTLDLANVTDNSMAIGSLAGDGIVLLASHDLNVGNNNLNTTFSGVIQDDGSLSKAGTGTLTLSGRNTYTGGTTVSGGMLLVNRSGNSGTGTGPVAVNAGTLAGNGKIAGAVTVGTGNGAGAFLFPGTAAANRLITLRIQSALILKADATYTCRLSTTKTATDQVVARGVTIESGAQFQFQQLGNRRLTIGTVFTVLRNTSPNAISGTFASLPDGSTFTFGRNMYQVSYEGGDGNDLTLTVVQ